MRRPASAFAWRSALAGLFALAALAAPAGANSILSVGGFGEPQLEEAARLRALGGAGAAEHGPRDISLVNPASLSDVDRILLQITALPAARRISASSGISETAYETTFPSARGVIALPGGIVIAGSYVAGTDAEFRVVRSENQGVPSTVEINGTGGMNFLRASVARRMAPPLRIGVDWEVISGSYRELWFRTFSDPGLTPARDTLETRYPKKARWRFGAQFVHEGWTLGGVFETSQNLPVEQRQSTGGASETAVVGRLKYPSGLALGISAPLRTRLRAVAQYRRQNWARSSFPSTLVDFRAQQRFSLGIERTRPPEGAGSGSIWSRIPLRVGGYFLQWPDLLPRAGASDISGGTVAVDERALTFGAGIVTKDQGGGLDLSLELGTRGDKDALGVTEKFARLGISFLVSDETWRGSFHR
ncbi:MAG TPA: hypothetical protein VET83_09785 [Candidatus Dormibacteraeota bacterium]|nr:hypothetical protein [Candidatus Dormibacteraeota bacterium]